MALNAKNKKNQGGKDFVDQPVVEEGTYPCRVVQVIELGLQPQRPHQGKEKPPVDMLYITYEMVDEFMVDEAGEEVLDKPRWQSEDFPYYGLDCDMAKCNKRLKGIDPKNKVDGDWAKIGGAPCNVTFAHNVKGDKTFVNVSAVTSVRPKDLKDMPKLQQPAKIFDIDEPDMEILESLPKWLQEKIKSNLNYKGSALEKAVMGDAYEEPEEEDAPKQEVEKPEKPEEQEVPEEELDEPGDAPQPSSDDDDNDEESPWG